MKFCYFEVTWLSIFLLVSCIALSMCDVSMAIADCKWILKEDYSCWPRPEECHFQQPYDNLWSNSTGRVTEYLDNTTQVRYQNVQAWCKQEFNRCQYLGGDKPQEVTQPTYGGYPIWTDGKNYLFTAYRQLLEYECYNIDKNLGPAASNCNYNQ